MNLLICFYTFMTALFTALIIVPFLRKWALDQGTLDIPGERAQHTEPMPTLGGIAIFFSFLLVVLVYVPVTPAIRGFLVGGLIVFVTGLVDDLTNLSPKRKFAGEVVACLAMIVVGKIWLTNLGDLFGFGDIILPVWIGIPFTIFAVVGVINAINLIDGLDGLAGGLSVMALSAFFLLGWITDDQQTALLAAALAGGILGFLKYNFYPARIFMGDAGSLTVGYILGFLAVYTTQQPNATISPMIPILILGLPVFDTVWVMSRRVLQGVGPFTADRSHMHHKFLDLGFEHRFTVIIIYSLMLFWISLALLFRTAPESILLFSLLGSAAMFYLCLRYMLRHQAQFTFLSRDSASSIRNSVTYLRIAALMDQLIPGLLPLLVSYLLLALWSIVSHNVLSWKIALILLAVGLYLWYRPLNESRSFLMLVLYVVFGMASVEVCNADDVVFAGFSIKRCGDILLAVAALIVIFKLQFRRIGELFLSTADYLALTVCVFLAIAVQQNIFDFNLNATLLRTLVAILAVRTLCSNSAHYYRLLAMSSFMFLAFAAVFGFAA
ncbi:MAG: undecaprenyl/decaprenyl-phosphate alpha-N-acetylglucosaminyl 1-phosphate transferase [Desulfuromonadales bacterium]|nr:undecaprenyl/decaprenyl-phosphate alpha-N-acetylglucosaminyl 1-phosphate transferase [Desulfuromonadales bacterium]